MGETGKFILTVLVFYGVLVATMYVIQRGMMYMPDTSPPSLQRGGVPDMAAATLSTEDGLVLRSWYKPAAPGRPTLVYFHGNAGNIEIRGYKARPYLDGGYGLLLVGYRGFGGNAGSPSEEGFYADGRAALAFLESQGVARKDMVVYGESLGSGIAVHMAWEAAGANRPLGAVVLEAPFTAMGDVAQHHYFYLPAKWLVKDRYDSASKIAAIGVPLLIVHGEADGVVPIKFGRRLFEMAVEPKDAMWISGYGHNDLYDSPVPHQKVMAFLERAKWPR